MFTEDDTYSEMPQRLGEEQAGTYPYIRGVSGEMDRIDVVEDRVVDQSSLHTQLDQAEQTPEAKRGLLDTLAASFNETADNVHIHRHGDNLVIYDQTTATPTNPNGQTIFQASIGSGGLMSLNISKLSTRPDLLDKPEMKKLIQGRQFLVKNCDSLASAELLISKFGVGNLVFDDANPNIAAFKADLEAKAGIKLTSQPENAHHVTRPGHSNH